MDNIEEIVSSDLLTCKSHQTNQLIIQVENFLFQRPNDFNIFENVDGEETGSRMLGISHLVDGALF